MINTRSPSQSSTRAPVGRAADGGFFIASPARQRHWTLSGRLGAIWRRAKWPRRVGLLRANLPAAHMAQVSLPLFCLGASLGAGSESLHPLATWKWRPRLPVSAPARATCAHFKLEQFRAPPPPPRAQFNYSLGLAVSQGQANGATGGFRRRWARNKRDPRQSKLNRALPGERRSACCNRVFCGLQHNGRVARVTAHKVGVISPHELAVGAAQCIWRRRPIDGQLKAPAAIGHQHWSRAPLDGRLGA